MTFGFVQFCSSSIRCFCYPPQTRYFFANFFALLYAPSPSRSNSIFSKFHGYGAPGSSHGSVARGKPRVRWSAMVDREHFDYYGYRARHNALVAAAQPMRHVHCKHRLAALYDRRRCEVKCAWLRSASVYRICTSMSMFRSPIRDWVPD